MEILKIAGLGLCAVILITIVKNHKPELGMPTAMACSLLLLYFLIDSMKYAVAYVAGIYDGLETGKTYLPIILKILAIAYITEFTTQLCKDAGESAIASKIELGGKIMIFCVAIPVFTSMLSLVEQML